MELKNKTILLISPEPWDHIFVSKHQYAIHLAKRGNRVFFLNPPGESEKVLESKFDNVWSVHYKGFIKGLRFFPSFLQRVLINRKFSRLQALCKEDFEVIWSFDNSVFFDFSALPDEIFKISHIVDLNQDFETSKAAKSADICLGVCSSIVENLKNDNENTFFINHGCDGHINKSKVRLPGKNRLKAFYAGNLNSCYIDWTLFEKIIVENKDVDFILAGSWSKGAIKNRIQLFANTYYIGQLEAVELNKFYHTADLLLLMYKADEFSKQLSNPHKMMGYLQSGKMIVSTFTMEYLRLSETGLVLMSRQNKEFPHFFQKAVKELEYWNSVDKQKIRQSYALNNTYDKQIDRIESIILEDTVN